MKTGMLLIAGAAIAFASSAHGHQGDRIYPIVEITEEAGIDLKME